MLIDFKMYLNHPYYKKINDYFDQVDLTDLSGQSYVFKIRDINLTERLLKETEFSITQNQMIDYVNDRMKDLVSSIVYKMMNKHSFDYYESGVDLDEDTNKLKVSLHNYHRQEEIVNKIEKTINGKNFVLNHVISVDLIDVNFGIYDYRYVDLFEIDLDNFSFEEIDNQLKDYANIKDQLILELQNM